MKLNPVPLLKFAGISHLGLLAAGGLMPRVLGLRQHIESLPPIIQNLFWVYYSFIAFCLVSFGLLSFLLAPALASGSALARAVCGFLAAFWTIRLAAAWFVFDLNPYLTSFARTAGYHTINVVFLLLPVIYLYTAIAGGRR